MKSSMLVLILCLTLLATPGRAQTPPPTQPTPAPQTAPATPQPPKPYPEGAKVAYISIQRIASESAEGKSSTTKVQALNQKKLSELTDRQKQIQVNQEKLQKSGPVMSDAARGELEKTIERSKVDLERAQQDAQGEVAEFQQSLQLDFERKLRPIINAIATEKSLHFLFNFPDGGIVFVDPGLDLTNDVIARFDKAVGSPTSAPAAAKPPATKPPETKPGTKPPETKPPSR